MIVGHGTPVKKYLCLAGMICPCVTAQELSLFQTPGGVELTWKREFPVSSGVPSQIDSRILVSPDLQNWVELSVTTADESLGDGWSSLQVSGNGGKRFFKLEESVSYQHRASLGKQPAVYGQQLLNAISSLPKTTVEEFGKEDPDCLPRISWDPTTATFWAEFNTSPEDHNALLPSDDPERRLTDFRLDAEELALFQQNGFVVSERVAKWNTHGFLGTYASKNPVDYYYKVWTDDLPVFISSDSILDAWHQTFVSMLEEMEELYLYPSFRKILAGVSDLSALDFEWDGSAVEGAEKVRQAIADLNVYLGTAQGLAIGEGLGSPAANADPSTIAHWLHSVSKHTETLKRDLYGDGARIEDMTLYKPRGHYTNSQALSAYFQTLIWLSRAQFQVASKDQSEQQDRELRAAVLLALHVREEGQLALWEEVEEMVQLLVGQSDAMTVKEMISLLESLSLDSVEVLTSDGHLATIRQALLDSTYGIQEINGGQAEAGGNCEHLTSAMPRALSLFGQRWTPDAWTFNQVVVPSVTGEGGETLHRRMPSGLDAMYAVLGNDAAAPILADRMQDTEGVPFRDGIPFHDELMGVRSVLDSQQSEFWQEHIYGSWLYSLRALSEVPSVSAPETFRTSAWKKRILNTQLASWTQLRHDTLLYAKQSFTPPLLCEFPDGYVDPYPALFGRISAMALRYKEAISSLNWEGAFNVEIRLDPWSPPGLEADSLQQWTAELGYLTTIDSPEGVDSRLVQNVDLASRQSVICDHLANFSDVCLQLQEMAEKQRSGERHTEDMKSFIRSLVEDEGEIYGGDRQYSGWFPNLYYLSSLEQAGAEHPSVKWNPVVADVHTDSIDILCTGDPGGVLHEGVGYTQFILVAVRHGDGSSCVFGGPVMSHYEFVTDRDTRLNDDEWEQRLEANQHPEPADWKRSFLVPEARAE